MINYTTGDATYPQSPGNKIICHVCNDIGGWGRGFVLAVSRRWVTPEHSYRTWAQAPDPEIPFELGQVQFVQVEPDIIVANMIGQHDVLTVNGLPPVRYEAIEACLKTVAVKAKAMNASIHAPRFGAGLAGGTWDKIEQIINRAVIQEGIPVTIYDYAPITR